MTVATILGCRLAMATWIERYPTNLTPEHGSWRDLHVMSKFEVGREDHRYIGAVIRDVWILHVVQKPTLRHRNVAPGLLNGNG